MDNLNYKYINSDSDELDGWKSRLSEEDKICLESDLDDYDWYAVHNNDGVVAIFQIIDVRNKYSKNLSIFFNPERVGRDIVDMDKIDEIIKVIIFIFHSIVQICSEKRMDKVKLHTHDALMGVVFARLADSHGEVKVVRRYGKWLEVEI